MDRSVKKTEFQNTLLKSSTLNGGGVVCKYGNSCQRKRSDCWFWHKPVPSLLQSIQEETLIGDTLDTKTDVLEEECEDRENYQDENTSELFLDTVKDHLNSVLRVSECQKQAKLVFPPRSSFSFAKILSNELSRELKFDQEPSLG